MARAQVHGLDPTRCPEIDFVSQTGDLDCVDRVFDNVFSSHCIEHQPDLARHLRQVESLLVPGGAYYLIIPDKRYCFDHYIAESRLSELYAAAAEKRRLHSDASILNHRLFTTHNRSLLHWLGLHGPRPSLATYGALLPAALAECAQARAGAYVHAWCFTPAGFREAIEGMRRLGLTSLEAAEVHATLYGHLEFYAVLRKPQ
jgi:SAM-dependent methyltransferase